MTATIGSQQQDAGRRNARKLHSTGSRPCCCLHALRLYARLFDDPSMPASVLLSSGPSLLPLSLLHRRATCSRLAVEGLRRLSVAASSMTRTAAQGRRKAPEAADGGAAAAEEVPAASSAPTFSPALTTIDPSQYDAQLEAKVARITTQFARFSPPPLHAYRSAPSHYRMRCAGRTSQGGRSLWLWCALHCAGLAVGKVTAQAPLFMTPLPLLLSPPARASMPSAPRGQQRVCGTPAVPLSLIHISEPTRQP